MIKNRIYDLEDRLIDFAIEISKIEENLPSSKFANHIGEQLIRSGSSPALNYGEAQSVESPNDFIHKLKVVFKGNPRKQSLFENHSSKTFVA